MVKARTLTLLCVLSMILFVALLVMQHRSLAFADYVSHYGPAATLDFYSESGGLHYSRSVGDATVSPRWVYLRLNESNEAPQQHRGLFFAGFEWWSDPSLGQSIVSVPYWFLVLLAGIPPVWWAWNPRSSHPWWVRYVVAGAIALWPFEVTLLLPHYHPSRLLAVGQNWVEQAVVAAVILGARDFIRLCLRVGPWPWQWRLRRKFDRARRGLCTACGYDLRASPESSADLLTRCPECGTGSDRRPVPVVELQGTPRHSRDRRGRKLDPGSTER